MLSDSWKVHRDYLENEEARKRKICEVFEKKNQAPPPYRPRIKTERELKEFQDKCSTWLQAFIDDENNRKYLHKGVQWYNPDKNFWRWIEIQVLPDDQEKPEPNPPSRPLPEEPESGQDMELNIVDTVDLDGHTEYLISVETNILNWYPYMKHHVLRRYNEFKAFYGKLKNFMVEQGLNPSNLPALPKAKVMGYKSKSTVADRSNKFQGILNFVASDQRLNSCGVVFDFFGIYPNPDGWKYSVYVDGLIK